jgi:hypothetical protein
VQAERHALRVEKEVTAERVLSELAKLAFCDPWLCSSCSFLSFPQHQMRVRRCQPSNRPGRG